MKTKILVLASNPQGTDKLRLDKEIAEIEDILERSKQREEFDLKPKLAVRVRDLQESIIKEKPRIVHFCGHGAGSEGLILEAESGKHQLVSNQALGDLFKLFDTKVECVMLNACYSQVQAEEINQHINYVIGTKKQIQDEAAIAFTQGFYTALFNGEAIERAYEFGCNRIQLDIYGSGDRERKLVPVESGERGDLVELPQNEVLVLLKREPLNQIEAEPVDNERAESRGDSPRNTQIDEGNYVENVERDYIQNVFNFHSEKPVSQNIPCNIKKTGSANFVGREKKLEELHQLLQEKDKVSISAIAGMGGIGKSELALQYALAYQNEYPGSLCWFSVRGENIGTQIIEYAGSYLNIFAPEKLESDEAKVQYCWRNWRSETSLVILDDVPNYEEYYQENVAPYLPPVTNNIKVLMTSRERPVEIPRLDLDVLAPEAAMELLAALAGGKRIVCDIERQKDYPSELCEWLGYLPLGLQLVGRYLKRKKTLSVAEILERLEKQKLTAKALLKPKQADMTAQLGVAAAFELSWDELNAEAQELGSYLSLFRSEPFKWSWVESAWLDNQYQKTESWGQSLWSKCKKLVDSFLKRQNRRIKEQAKAKNLTEILENLRDEELVDRNLLKVTIDRDCQFPTKPQYQLHLTFHGIFWRTNKLGNNIR